MYRNVLITAIFVLMGVVGAAASTYDYEYKHRRADNYIREAEYYKNKAEGHYREMESYNKKAKSYQQEAEYYTNRGDSDRAKRYLRYAEDAIEDGEREERYGKQADSQAAYYLRQAANALSY